MRTCAREKEREREDARTPLRIRKSARVRGRCILELPLSQNRWLRRDEIGERVARDGRYTTGMIFRMILLSDRKKRRVENARESPLSREISGCCYAFNEVVN